MVDELPEDLDVTSAFVGPYVFPNIRRRRIAGSAYLVLAAACGLGWWASGNGGLAAVAILLGAIGAYHWLTAWDLAFDQTDALTVASRAVGFPVGHASAQLAWRGLRSRPTWRVLVYSAEDPPAERGLVELDGVDGEVISAQHEPNPEDWSHLGGA